MLVLIALVFQIGSFVWVFRQLDREFVLFADLGVEILFHFRQLTLSDLCLSYGIFWRQFIIVAILDQDALPFIELQLQLRFLIDSISIDIW